MELDEAATERLREDARRQRLSDAAAEEVASYAEHAKKFDVDVLVCGGGVAGAAAGIAAARLGARTLLVEGRESLGGLCTNGYISGIAGVVEGLCEEWVDRLAAKGAALKRPHLPVIEPEMGKMELEQMLLQAGCRVLYGVHVADCVVEDGAASSRSSPIPRAARWRSRAKVFIDCTGDADLAFAAGVPCEVGSAEYCGLNQSVTMGFRLSYVNVKKYEEAEAAFQKTQHAGDPHATGGGQGARGHRQR